MFNLDGFIKHLKKQQISGATQEAIGKIIGKNQAYISQIKNGERPFLPEYLDILSKEYGEKNVMQFYTPDTNMINANHGSTSVAGNGNTITNNDVAGLIELQKGYQLMLKEKDKQIDRLLSIIENSINK